MSLDDNIAGMTCAEVLAALGDYVDGELAAEARAKVEAHVTRCTNCERFGGMFGEVVRGIRAYVDAPDPDEPAAFDRLRQRLETLP